MGQHTCCGRGRPVSLRVIVVPVGLVIIPRVRVIASIACIGSGVSGGGGLRLGACNSHCRLSGRPGRCGLFGFQAGGRRFIHCTGRDRSYNDQGFTGDLCCFRDFCVTADVNRSGRSCCCVRVPEMSCCWLSIDITAGASTTPLAREALEEELFGEWHIRERFSPTRHLNISGHNSVLPCREAIKTLVGTQNDNHFTQEYTVLDYWCQSGTSSVPFCLLAIDYSSAASARERPTAFAF